MVLWCHSGRPWQTKGRSMEMVHTRSHEYKRRPFLPWSHAPGRWSMHPMTGEQAEQTISFGYCGHGSEVQTTKCRWRRCKHCKILYTIFFDHVLVLDVEPQQFPGRLEDIAPLAQVLWRNAVKTSKGEGGETLRRPRESRWMALTIQHVIRLQQQSKQVELELLMRINQDMPFSTKKGTKCLYIYIYIIYIHMHAHTHIYIHYIYIIYLHYIFTLYIIY